MPLLTSLTAVVLQTNTIATLLGALVVGIVPLAVLVIVIYRLAQIAENTSRIADSLERLEVSVDERDR